MSLSNLLFRNSLLITLILISYLILFNVNSNAQSCDEPMPVQSCTTNQIENECSGCGQTTPFCCPASEGCSDNFSGICNGNNCTNINICQIPDECTGTAIPNCAGQDLTDCSVCSENEFCCPSSTGGAAACNSTFSVLCNGNTCTDQNICTYVPLPPVLERDFTFINNCGETIWVGALTNQFNGGFELTGSCTMDSDCENACPSIDGITGCTATCKSGACSISFTGNINTNVAESISGRFWPMTGCDFDNTLVCSGGTGNAGGDRCCDTGSCTIEAGGFGLQCNSSGDSPNTVTEFTLTSGANNDFYDISLIDGYNVPVEMKPTGNTADAPNGFDTSYWCGNPGGLDSTTVSSLDCPWDTEFGLDCNGNPDFRAVGSLQTCTEDSVCGSGSCNVSSGVCECKEDTDCNVSGDICGVPNPGFTGFKACGTLTGCTTAKDICGLYFGQGEKGDTCGQDELCSSGTCLAPNSPQTCSMDSDCDAVCMSGTCENNSNISCTMDSECTANCVDDQCRKPCTVTSDCSSEEVCAEGICQCIPNVCNSNGMCTNDGDACTTTDDCTQTCDGICTEGPADFLSCNETVTNKKLSCTLDSDCPALVGLPACTADTDCPANTKCVDFGAAPAPGQPEIAKVCRLTCDTGTNLCLGPICTDNSDCTGMSNSISLSGTFMQCDTTSGNCVATNTSLFEGAGLTGQSCYIDYYDSQVVPSAWCNGCPTEFNNIPGNENWPSPADPCLNSNPDWVSVAEPLVEGFKEACPSAYSFPFDDPTSTFQCTNDTQTNSMAYQVTFCPAPQFPPPPPPPPPVIDDDTTEPPIKINPGENGPFVSIEFDPDLDGGGQILVDLPPGVLAQFAQLNPVVGDCEIVSQTARVTNPDVICRVEDFPENLDMLIEFCKEADQQGVVQAAVEVISDGMPEEEFSNFLDILLDELELCSSNGDDAGDDGSDDITNGDDTETGGCALAPAGRESNSLPLLLLIPAIIIFRRLNR